MNEEEFMKITRVFLTCVEQRLHYKATEYQVNSDRYSQFYKQAALNDMTIEEIIQVLMSKHITKLCDTRHEMKYDEFQERALDVMAYLCLMNGCYKEAENL